MRIRKGDIIATIYDDKLNKVHEAGVPVKLNKIVINGLPRYDFIATENKDSVAINDMVLVNDKMFLVVGTINDDYLVIGEDNYPTPKVVHNVYKYGDVTGKIIKSRDESLVLLVYGSGEEYHWIWLKGFDAWGKIVQRRKGFEEFIKGLVFCGEVKYRDSIVIVEAGPDSLCNYVVVDVHKKYLLVAADWLRNI